MNNLTRPEIVIVTSKPAPRRPSVLILVLCGLLLILLYAGRWLWKYADWVIICLWGALWFIVSLKVTGWF